ncbi:MAG TPA: sulfatase [Abditibacteriaceae bacterium]|jgi:arylsulfatase A-like enzyme
MNVVLVAIDSLRADHLGCYGYDLPTSPHIDALAAESVLFERAFAPGIPTTPSFTTLMTGLHPYRHGILAHLTERRLKPETQTIAQVARRAGYATAGIDNLAVQGNGRGSWMARGFDYYSAFLFKPFSNQCEELTNRALSFIDDLGAQPFFLFLHLWDPHTPYGPPPPFDTLHYHPGRHPFSIEEIKSPASEYYDAFLADMKLQKPDDYDWIMAQYDGEISYVDTQIERLTAHLKAKNLWDETIFVLMSDHGEAFGEGGFHFDHHGLYDAVIRVALTMRVPGIAAVRSKAMVSTEDILPTLCQLADWPLPDSEITGRSFTSSLTGAAARDEIFAVEATRQASLALRTQKWKFIQPIVRDKNGASLPDFHGNLRDNAPLLFDLENDAAETQNVAAQFLSVRDELSARLTKWHQEEVARRNGDDPLLDGLTLPVESFLTRIKSRNNNQ